MLCLYFIINCGPGSLESVYSHFIACVQYCADVQHRGGYHDTCGGYLMYRGDVQYRGDHDNCGVIS